MTVRGESLVLAKTDPGNLCFDRIVKGSVTVRDTFSARGEKSAAYKEGADYIVDYAEGTISRTKSSSMPNYSKNVLYGQTDFDHYKFSDYSNHPFFVWVDYATTNGKAFAEPNDQARFLTGARAKLEAGGPFAIVWYGDSITAGGEASAPEMRFQSRYIEYLRGRFPKAEIDSYDASIPGYTSAQGIDWWDEYMGKKTRTWCCWVGA